MINSRDNLRDIKDKYRFGFSVPEDYVFKSRKGLSQKIVEEISFIKSEPAWMRDFRLSSYKRFTQKPMPNWGGNLGEIKFDDIFYYLKPTQKEAKNWEDLPQGIRETYDKIGIPEAEKKYLAGVKGQYECLSGDTIIFANPSAAKIKEIKVGSFVYSLDEESKELKKQRGRADEAKGKREVYLVKVAGREIKATANHPLLTLVYTKEKEKKRGRFGTAWKYLSDLKVGDYIAVVKDLPDEGQSHSFEEFDSFSIYQGKNQFGSFSVKTDRLFARTQPELRLPAKSSEDLMWFLGYYLGDGILSRANSKASVKSIVDLASFEEQPDVREKLLTVVPAIFGYKITCFERYRIKIKSRVISRFMESIGFVGLAKTKRIPEWIFGLPKSEKISFLAGYIDADGYARLGKKNNDLVITSCNRELLQQVNLLAISCGLRASAVF